ncbi:MAG: efflux RND transporter permease subunit [Rhodopila sp.]
MLIAVYLPIGFQSGLTGALFTEFAFTVVGAVTVSAIVALTLSPMMCANLLKPHPQGRVHGVQDRIVALIDRTFSRLQRGYERALRGSLRTMSVTLIFAALVISGIYYLYSTSSSELAPQEDQGVVILLPSSSPSATLQQKELFSNEVAKIMQKVPEGDQTFQVESSIMSIAGVTLKPWEERKRNALQIQQAMQGDLSKVTGQRIAAFLPPALPGAQGLPIQYVLKTTRPLSELYPAARQFLREATASGLFLFIDTDLKIDAPQQVIEIDRDKAAQLGLSMTQIEQALGGLLGGAYTNYFSLGSRSYKVISQVQQRSRLTIEQVMQYQIATINGQPIPVSAIASVRSETVPQTINHFQQQNSATIQGVPALGVAQADALQALQAIAARTLPNDVLIDYAGPLRQYVQESSGFLVTFGLALIIIFLSLAALFESFRDPVVILISIPMSVAGALLFINLGLGGATLNIYTEVGLVTLMGLISKHGILIVEVANEAQRAGRTKLEAIIYAAGIRLRPILMTTAAMVLGVVPLIFASGAGAASRFAMGLVIASGLSIGTLFTLFVLPAVYMLIAARHKGEKVAEEVEEEALTPV